MVIFTCLYLDKVVAACLQIGGRLHVIVKPCVFQCKSGFADVWRLTDGMALYDLADGFVCFEYWSFGDDQTVLTLTL